jgi:hypothetical protein
MTTVDYATSEPLAKAFFDVSFRDGSIPEIEEFVNHFNSAAARSFLLNKAESSFLAGAKWALEMTVEQMVSDTPDDIADMIIMELYANSLPLEGSDVAEQMSTLDSDLLMMFVSAFFAQGAQWGIVYRKSRRTTS